MDLLWINDEEIDESLRVQIEELNRCFFPENLVDGKYVLGKKQYNPIRLIISKDNHVIGHLLAVERSVGGMNMIYVGELCVEEKSQGKGYGKLLLETFYNRFSSLNYDFSILCCEEKNREFYSKHGWKNIDIDLYMEGRKAEGCVMVQNFSGVNIPCFDIGASV
jgi:predicted N-acetyltransferase YhbS